MITMKKCYPFIEIWKLRTDYIYEDKCRKEERDNIILSNFH